MIAMLAALLGYFPQGDFDYLLEQVEALSVDLERQMGENMSVRSENAVLRGQVARLERERDAAIQERDFHFQGFKEMERRTHDR